MAEGNMYAFLKLDGIEGESQDDAYKNQIEVQSFGWGASNSSSFRHGTGSGVGVGDTHDIQISKYTDKSSLTLMNKCTTGKTIPSGQLTLLKMQGETKIAYFKIELTDVVITAWTMSGSGGGELPSENVTLHFVKHKTSYLPQGDTGDPTGNVDFSWDIQKNKAA